jgi:hypothetical protein
MPSGRRGPRDFGDFGICLNSCRAGKEIGNLFSQPERRSLWISHICGISRRAQHSSAGVIRVAGSECNSSRFHHSPRLAEARPAERNHAVTELLRLSKSWAHRVSGHLTQTFCGFCGTGTNDGRTLWDIVPGAHVTGGIMAVVAQVPKTIRFCKVCQRETSHEVRRCDSSVVRICTACIERAQAFEQDRE